MLKNITSILILTLISKISFASGIQGFVKDNSGTPLPFATIFVKETGTGTVTNEEGYYEINLQPGNYNLVYQYLGFESIIKEVYVQKGSKVQHDIVLGEQVLELKTIDVLEGREDPAYTIMRKAIAKAEFHLQQIEQYTAMVYIKGSGRLLKSPKILTKMIEKEGVDSTTAFLVESVSEISYQRPNTYTEKVVSIREQGDNNDVSPNGYINGSFYESKVGESISPLSPKAFAYYKFEFLGSYFERGYEINKIKVTPRSRGEGVFEGTLSIVGDWWSIHSLKLKTWKLGIGFEIQQFYAPIEDKAWLPVTHQFEVDAKIFGFRFVYNYLATVSDYKIELNPDLDINFKVIDEKIEKELAAELEKQQVAKKGSALEKLASGEELTRKDLKKIIKEYEKEERKQRDEPEMVSNYHMDIDSNASNRDTLFWEQIRPVPLTKYEVKSYRNADSLALVKRTKAKEDSLNIKNKKGGVFSLLGIAFGDSWRLGENSRISYGSPIVNAEFNSVEGYALPLTLSLRNAFGEHNHFKIGGTTRYSFARNKWLAKGFLELNFGEKHRKNILFLEGGRYVSQFNEDEAIEPIINTAYALLAKESYVKLYEKQYGKIFFQKQVTDKLQLSLSTELSRRHALENEDVKPWNNTDSKAFSPNNPENIEIGNTLFETHDALVFKAGVEWKPWQKYQVRNNERLYINNAPILFGRYSKGITDALGSDVDFDLIELGSKFAWNRYDGSRMDLKISIGTYLNSDSLAFPDFRHFPGNQILTTSADPAESFRLLSYYKYSTKDQYLQAHLHYQFRKLLITQIMEVWMIGLKENLFVNYLATPSAKNYIELGYGLDNIFKIFRIEVTTSFHDFKYQDFGIRIGISSTIGVGIGEGESGEGKSVSVGF